MLDIKRVVEEIFKTVSEPIKKLAARISVLEKSNSTMEPVVLDLLKYTSLLENFSKHMEWLSVIDIRAHLFKPEDVKRLVDETVAYSKKDVEEKIPNEDVIVERINQLLGPAISLLEKRIDELPKPAAIDYEILKPEPLPDIQAMIAKEVDRYSNVILALQKRIDEFPKPEPIDYEKFPKPPELPDIPAMINEVVELAMLKHEEESFTLDQVKELASNLFEQKLASIELPKTPELPDIEGMIKDAVDEMFKGYPVPKDGEPGKSITLEDVKPFIEEVMVKLVAAIPPAKDGVGTSGAVIDRDGNLVLTLTNGKTISLGRIVGKDVDMAEVDRIISEKVAAIPKPKDGFGFDDLSLDFDGLRTVTFKFVKEGSDDKIFPITFPTAIYRDVFVQGRKYELGDMVTWGGSIWHCNKSDTKSKPGDNSDWTLAAKRGRDGKEVVTIPRDPKKPFKKED